MKTNWNHKNNYLMKTKFSIKQLELSRIAINWNQTELLQETKIKTEIKQSFNWMRKKNNKT